MNRELAMKVANAVLYEGYMLYPYRPSAIKNRQRWSFGILYPPEYHEVGAGTERSQMHSECIVKLIDPSAASGGNNGTPASLHIQLRFLHLVAREVSQKWGESFEPVPSLVVEGKPIESWEEGVEREVEFEATLNETWVPRSSHLLAGAGQFCRESTAPPLRQAQGRLWPNDGQNGAPQAYRFGFPASIKTEPIYDGQGIVVGEIRRQQHEIAGTISVAAAKLSEQVIKLAIDISNTSALPGQALDRDSALLTSLLSAHTILSITGGEFVSLLDPPEDLRQAVSECKNMGNFPVLVGAEGERDMMLCSPIVLYDYPQIAPESAGDFFDGTEMDEMLTLRVMTLTDDEKDQMRSGNDHVRNLLQRTEASAREQLMRTHGTIRSMKPVNQP